MPTVNVRTLIPPSVSGTGRGVYTNTFSSFSAVPVKGSFDQFGKIVITGIDILKVEEWIYQQSPEVLELWFKQIQLTEGINWKDIYLKLHWSDILALSLISKTKGENPYTKLQGYHAGDNKYVYMDELKILMWIKELYKSNGSLDWNKLIARDFPYIPDDTIQPDSPLNPNSPIFDPNKPLFTYDPDNGIVVYKSGEILWQKTGGQYYDTTNGQAVSYDKANQTVRFSTGYVLNLKTLELTKTDNQKVIIKNTLPWYKQIFVKLLSDPKTQYSVLAGVVILLIIKKRRNDEN